MSVCLPQYTAGECQLIKTGVQEGSALSYTPTSLGCLEMQTPFLLLSSQDWRWNIHPKSEACEMFPEILLFSKRGHCYVRCCPLTNNNICLKCSVALQHSSVFPPNILTHEKFVLETRQNKHPSMPITTLMCIITTCGLTDHTISK